MRTRLILSLCVLSLLTVLCASVAQAADDEKDFKPLFNGKDLEGWDGDPQIWSVKDGVIVGEVKPGTTIKTNTFLIWRDGKVDNFVLRFRYKLTDGNTGVQYRSHEIEGVPYGMGGYQADIAGDDWISGINYEERGRGILAKQGTKVRIAPDGKIEVTEQFATDKQVQAAIKQKEWNDYEVIVEGNHLIHKINGQVTSEVVDDQPEKRADSGLLGLQVHAGIPKMHIEFKDIRLKALAAK